MDSFVTFLAVSVSIKFILGYLNGGRRPSKADYVGQISEILFYPVKGTRPIRLIETECLHRGLKYPEKKVFDRNFIVVSADGKWISPTTNPRLTLIDSTVDGDHIVLSADGFGSVKIPVEAPTDRSKVQIVNIIKEDVEGQDCGDDVGAWIDKVLHKQGCRLLYGAEKLSSRKLNKQTDAWKKPAKDEDYITFQNSFPVMLASESSLADLNSKLSDPLSMLRFRPNFVVSGSKPFEEDSWRELWIGDVKFTQLKPCIRCPTTLTDPKTGLRDPKQEPLRTLKTYRLVKEQFGVSPLFGILLVLDSPAHSLIRVGDPVHVLRGKVY